MARVVGPLYSLRARGAFRKEMIYSEWRTLPYVKAYYQWQRPTTARNTWVEAQFKKAAQAWSSLTEPQREAWRAYARTVEWRDRLSATSLKMPAFNLWCALACRQYDLGAVPTGWPPTITPPPPVTSVAVAWNVAREAWAFTAPLAWAAPGLIYDVWRAGPVSAGRFPGHADFRHFLYATPAADGKLYLRDAPAPGYYHFFVRTIHLTTGLPSLSLRAPAILSTWEPDATRVLDIPFREPAMQTCRDLSGQENHGAIIGPTWDWNGVIGPCLNFNGTTDYVNCGDTSGMPFDKTATVEVFAKRSTINTAAWVIHKGGQSNNTFDFVIRFPPTNQLYWGFGKTTTTIPGQYALSPITSLEWMHIVGTYDDNTYALWVNGISVPLGTAATENTNIPNLHIGQLTNGTYRFNGLIDEVRIHTRVLSDAEIIARAALRPT